MVLILYAQAFLAMLFIPERSYLIQFSALKLPSCRMPQRRH
jgi:hypothetical protein